MPRANTSRLVIAAMCLMLFQVQLFAASTLGCLHDAGNAAAAGCPLHHAGLGPAVHADVNDSGAQPHCAKCALSACLHHLAVIGAGPLPGLSRLPPAHPAPHRHFYRYIPESVLRPPIPLLS